jgi:hypothetical protein
MVYSRQRDGLSHIQQQECQWLLKLHAFGQLNNSFQPTDEIRIARTLWRQRSNLVAEASGVIQRMQKVLTEMNVQLSNVLSDLSGVSGMKIVGAILEGERDPWAQAALVEPGVEGHPERYCQEPFQKPCIAGSRSRWNNQLKAKLLCPFGQRSDLLLTIPAFVEFGSFINVRLSVFDQPLEQAASLRAMAVMALGAPRRVRRRRYCAPR